MKLLTKISNSKTENFLKMEECSGRSRNRAWEKIRNTNKCAKEICLRLNSTKRASSYQAEGNCPNWLATLPRAVARKKLQPRRTHGPLYEISRMKSSNIISLIKKNKNRQYLVKFYRGECLGSPHTGYGGVAYDLLDELETNLSLSPCEDIYLTNLTKHSSPPFPWIRWLQWLFL